MHRVMKADFHTHSADDPRDALRYSTEMLIDAAAARGVEVLALTLHEWFDPCPRLERYAAQRGILLLPAIEQNVEGCHIVLINPDTEQAQACTFADLRALGRRDAAFIAPHPYYPLGSCLGAKLVQNIDLFDAIEYCTLYARGINWPNRRAARTARRHGLPLVGTSDSHSLPYADSTHTLITGEKTVEGIVEALREGRVELVTTPRSWLQLFRLVMPILRDYAVFLIDEKSGRRRAASPSRPQSLLPGDLHLNETTHQQAQATTS